MKPNWCGIISEAVDRGLRFGYDRAHKHTDTPDKELILDQQFEAIFLELDQFVIWDTRNGEGSPSQEPFDDKS